MKKKINVGIIGACASRDAFNRRITPNYKDIFNVSCYDFQMSFPSLMSPIIEYDSVELYKSINKLEYIERQHLYEDFNKSFLNELAVKQPDVLIIDFYTDINFGFVKLANSFITNKLFKYEKSEYISKLSFGNEYSGRNNFDSFFPIWKESIDCFMKYCNKYIPNTLILLNDFRLATYYYDAINNQKKLIKENHSPEFVANINRAMEKCNNWFKDKYAVDSIDLTGKEYFGNPKHIWGLDHLHLMPDYYSDFLWKLIDICMDKINNNRTSNLINAQLLQNGNFSRKFAGWDLKNTGWEILNEKEYSYLSISKNGYQESKNWQVWSEPYEISNGINDNEITISFEVRSDNWNSVDEEVFFCIRSFDKREKYNQKDSKDEILFEKHDYTFEPNEWKRIVYSFNPTGRFVRLAPYLKKNGSVQYRNVSLVYGGKPIKEWKPCLNEIISAGV